MKQTKKLRMSGIGGSDAAIICGISPWMTPLELYKIKIGEVLSPDKTPSMHFGQKLERIVAEEYARRTGNKLKNDSKTYRHPDYSWMMAHIDRIVDGGKILECKTASSFSADEWGESGTSDFPEYYRYQLQHYMSVTGIANADIAVLIGGNDFRIFPVEKNEELIDHIIQKEKEFWECVQQKREPEPMTLNDLKVKYPESVDKSIIAGLEISDMIESYREIQKEIKAKEEIGEEMKFMLQNVMGDTEKIIDRNGKKLISWKTQTRENLDIKKLKEEIPSVYEKYLVSSKIRVFR